IIVGSLTAFVIGQFVDAFSFRWMKRMTGDRRIWLRATGSTLISQLIDSVVVTYVAFWLFRDMTFAMATALALTAYVY
ncbi:MAG: queuosine precursor transporter, partial [Flavobacteriales bacterium]|nr:queuosine precursor transporter [Flavobacteriales bacterium]